MVADRVRMDAYAEALRRTVRPGCTVLDIGTGFGIHALLACQLGAGRVYAIEPSPAIQSARELASANGFGARIQFIQGLSTEFEPPERADVIVSDLRGGLPPHKQHIPSLVDARDRLLAPGGVLIPECDDLYVAVVGAERAYRAQCRPWGEDDHDLDMRPLARRFVNRWADLGDDRGPPLTPGARWASLDYGTVTTPHLRGEARWTLEQNGIGRGLRVWFDATLIDGVRFSTGPGQAETVYGTSFLPWQEPVPLCPGDDVSVEIRADLVGENYTWTWNTQVLDGGAAGRPKAQFRQSTFLGQLLSPDALRRLLPDHVPTLKEEGRLLRFVLDKMETGLSLQTIARDLWQRYPSSVADENAALERVRDISARYGA
jgi:protein arginine N-methyltransferase 1